MTCTGLPLSRTASAVAVSPGRGLGASERLSVLFVGEVEGDNVVTLPVVVVAA